MPIFIYILRSFGLVWHSCSWLMVLIFLLNLISALFPVITLWLTKLTIDQITLLVGQSGIKLTFEVNHLWVLIGTLGFVWLVDRGVDTLNNTLSRLLGFKVEMYTHTLIIQKCAHLDIVFFENPEKLNILEKASGGATGGASSLLRLLFTLIRNFVTLGTFLVALISLHWLVAVVVAATTMPQMIASSFFARKRWNIASGNAEDTRLRYYLTWLLTMRDPAKEVRFFELSDYLLERFKFYGNKLFNIQRNLEIRQETTNFLLGILANVGAVGIWAYVAFRAIAKTISMGDVVFFTQTVNYCQGNLVSLFKTSGLFYEQSLFLGNLFALLDIRPSDIEGALQPCGDHPAPKSINQGIEFRNVSFHYPGSENLVLRNVSFCIRPGESLALVGPNGTGKTTLLKLLVRLYDPTSGEILLDNRDLRDYDLDGLRRTFAIIFQDFTRFFLTLRENIGFGDVQRVGDISQVRKASLKADVEEISNRLLKKYETYLGKQWGLGEDLSVGEWQKVALARAYMRDCPFIILDEPTSSLDPFAESNVYKELIEMTSSRTVVLVSHRISTVRMADKILVLDNGRLVEEGNHKILMSRHGLYASMFETQAKRYQ